MAHEREGLLLHAAMDEIKRENEALSGRVATLDEFLAQGKPLSLEAFKTNTRLRDAFSEFAYFATIGEFELFYAALQVPETEANAKREILPSPQQPCEHRIPNDLTAHVVLSALSVTCCRNGAAREMCSSKTGFSRCRNYAR